MNVKRHDVLGGLSALTLVSTLVYLFVSTDIRAVYVADFKSDSIATCRPSDVDLNRRQVEEFFRRSRTIESKVLHDHYDLAPCSIQGTLKYGLKACEWEVRAGATGSITCDKDIKYFVCESCEDLFAGARK